MTFIINITLCFFLILSLCATEQVDFDQSNKTVPGAPFDTGSFLKKCADRLSIYNFQEVQLSPLPEKYDEKDIITVHWKGRDGNVETVQVYDPLHELMDDQKFDPQDKASGGTRTVGFYSIDGKKRLCFKQWPEAPWTERATDLLYQKLFPNTPSLPKSEVILMKGQVFLIFEYIEGEPLESFLEKAHGNPTAFSLNMESFQRLAIFCLLTNPEDCRLQNCLVRKMGNSQEYQIVLIDNERNFGQTFIEEVLCGRAFFDKSILGKDLDRIIPQGVGRFAGIKVGTRAHCVLFCFHEMLKEQLGSSVLEEIGRSTVDVILARQFDAEDKYQKNLKGFIDPRYVSRLTDGAGKTRETIGVEFRETILGNRLGSWFLERVFYGWPRIIETVQAGKSCEHVFIEVQPRLTELYGIQTTTAQTVKSSSTNTGLEHVLERIKLIDAGRNGPKTPPSAWLPMRRYFRSSILPYRMAYPLPSNLSIPIPMYHLPQVIDPENWIGVVARAKELFTESMDEGDRAQIIESAADISPENWQHIKAIVDTIITKEMNGYDYAEIIQTVKSIDREQKILKDFLVRVRILQPEVKDINAQLMEAMMNVALIKSMCRNWEFTEEDKNEILEISGFKDIAMRAVEHFPRYLEVSNYIKEGVKNIEPHDPWVQENLTGIIERTAITDISPDDWERESWIGMITRTKELLSDKSMNGFGYAQILEAVKDISPEDWPATRTRIEEVVPEGMSGGDYAEIIEAVKRADIEQEKWIEIIEQYKESIKSYRADQIATLIALTSKEFFVFRRPINTEKSHTY